MRSRSLWSRPLGSSKLGKLANIALVGADSPKPLSHHFMMWLFLWPQPAHFTTFLVVSKCALGLPLYRKICRIYTERPSPVCVPHWGLAPERGPHAQASEALLLVFLFLGLVEVLALASSFLASITARRSALGLKFATSKQRRSWLHFS